ncbi:MAG: hypothetical protein CMN34_05975 [Saprospirales bacterium]|nr:hypothetical protein [Saprospirales bacterium]
MKAMLYIYLVMQGPILSKDLVSGRQYMRYSPPPLGAFCIVEERISPRGIQLNLGLTEQPNLPLTLP